MEATHAIAHTKPCPKIVAYRADIIFLHTPNELLEAS
jgi:hypothetical protein